MRGRLTRRLTFHATHRMALPAWSDEEARTRFGALADPPGHGHLYRVAVTVEGPLDPVLGTVMDLGVLDAVLEREVTSRLDGGHLNEAVEAFARGEALPTCEALAADIWRRVAPTLPDGVALARVVVAEDETLEGECLGPA